MSACWWSVVGRYSPGGGLDRTSDKEHDWLSGVMREVMEEAGAGQPSGIPPVYPVAFTQVPATTINHPTCQLLHAASVTAS
jgi:hypothetical protein